MQANKLTDELSVRGQISPGDVLASSISRAVGETDGQPTAREIEDAARDAGLGFHHNPVAPGAMTAEAVSKQGEVLGAAAGKVLAYCGSGQRATMLWMLSNPDNLSADERIERAAAAGYDLAGLRPQL